jgi:serine protease Do
MIEHQQDLNPHHALPEGHQPHRPNPIVFSVVLSVLFGALSGGIMGYALFGTKTGQSVVSSTLKTISVQEESATIDVVKKTNPAVVSVIASKDFSKIYGNTTNPFDLFGFSFGGNSSVPSGKQTVSSGSGFVVRADGLIVTNKHVVSDEQASYTVVMNDGKTYDAKVLAKDPINDIALIKVEGKDMTTLTLGDSSKVQIGQTVIAIGNALGQYKNTVTKGVISGQARTITASDGSGGSETLENVFQTDASINPGNSGGPLLDLDGSVIAMNTAVDSQGQLIGFAIPINVVKKDIEQVDKTGKITQPYLGIRYVMLTKAVAEKNSLPVETGAWIQPSTTESDTPVVKDSPAAKAGIIANDIITSINGTALDDTHSLISILSNYKPGETVTVEYYRGKDKKSVKITLAERPS